MAQKKVAEKNPPAKPQGKAKSPTSTPRLQVIFSEHAPEPGPRLTCPLEVFGVVGRELVSADREHFMVLHLDAKNRLLAKELVSTGSLTASTVHPREVFKGAVLNGSASIICVHNHPSGDPAPSLEDRAITARLKQAGELMGIRLADHIIVGRGTGPNYYSFVDRGGLPDAVHTGEAATAAEAAPSQPCPCSTAWLNLSDRLHDLHARLHLLECLDWDSLNGNTVAQYGHELTVQEIAGSIKQIEEELGNLHREAAVVK